MSLINRGDANADRQLASDELAAVDLDAATMKFDRNQNQRLSVSELAEYLADRRRRLGMTPSDQLLARNLIRKADQDGDGLVPASLFQPADGDVELGSPDQNGDGSLSLLELETFLAKRRKGLGFDDEAAARASILIARNDSNADRKLSKSELVASGADRDSPLSPHKFALIDQDGDAAIDMQELARFIQKSRRP